MADNFIKYKLRLDRNFNLILACKVELAQHRKCDRCFMVKDRPYFVSGNECTNFEGKACNSMFTKNSAGEIFSIDEYTFRLTIDNDYIRCNGEILVPREEIDLDNPFMFVHKGIVYLQDLSKCYVLTPA
jgi:hypothetical protein